MDWTLADRSAPSAPTEIQIDTPPFTSAFNVQDFLAPPLLIQWQQSVTGNKPKWSPKTTPYGSWLAWRVVKMQEIKEKIKYYRGTNHTMYALQY